MAVTHNFRSAFSGFNREDVVHYLEYLNAKHTAQTNQLMTELEELRQKLAVQEASAPDIGALESLRAECAELKAALAQAESERDAALAQAETPKEPQPAAIAQEELEAYRRAERAERIAKERADQIYQQATGTLAQATTQVDHAACQISAIIAQVNEHLANLQTAVDDSKCSLQDAAATMAAIRPESPEAE